MKQRWLMASMPYLFTAGFFLIWQVACMVGHIPEFVLPAPIRVFEVIIRQRDALAYHAWFTLAVTLVGFAVAVAAGIGLGLVIGVSPAAYAGLYPLLIAFNAVPKVAVVPILVIWTGIGAVPAIISAFIISFFPIVVNVATGLATIEPETQDVMRSLGASRYKIMTKVGIPRSMPYLFASLKVAITLAFVGSVISETIAGDRGIGALMMRASTNFDTPLSFAGLTVVAAMGVGMYFLFALLERRFVGWAFRAQNQH